MSLLNPMNIGPTWQGNYIQPNTVAPTVDARVATYPVGANILNLTWPIPKYVQPQPTPGGTHAAFPLGDGNG